MTTANPPADQLAREFSVVLRSWLTAAQMADVIERNASETCPGVCHSHDFCDANMAMLEVFEAHGLDPLLPDSDPRQNDMHVLWGEAWNIAKSNQFSTT